MQIHINSFKHKEIFVLPTTFSFYQPLFRFINHFFVLPTTFSFYQPRFVLPTTFRFINPFSFYQPRFFVFVFVKFKIRQRSEWEIFRHLYLNNVDCACCRLYMELVKTGIQRTASGRIHLSQVNLCILEYKI